MGTLIHVKADGLVGLATGDLTMYASGTAPGQKSQLDGHSDEEGISGCNTFHLLPHCFVAAASSKYLTE